MKIINASKNNLKFQTNFAGKSCLKECHMILNNMGEITPQSYSKMPEMSKNFIRNNIPFRMQELAKTTCEIASKVKDKYDRIFGKNNYMIIALGRSIASVAEAFNFLGGEAKVIPLSKLGYFLPKRIPDVDKYREYLTQIGLTKQIIQEHPEKKFILMDYSVSGDSLSTAKEFLENPELLGKSENFIDREINPTINSLNILKLFYHERFKNFSPVGKLTLDNLKDVSIQGDSATSKEGRGNICQFVRKMFLFNLLDVLHQDNYHHFKPENEIAIIKKRYEDPDFLDKKLTQELQDIFATVIN